jgi:calcineurin-like phosphoesterase family protein
MSHVYFIGDLHFGHHHIGVFRKEFPNEAVHRQYLMDIWTDTVRKRDVVYVMGDAAFTQDGLDSISTLAGRKILIRGNHDLLPTEAYLSVFEEVYGALAWKGLWLTHIPMHPSELYGRTNVHGHCHRGGPSGVYEAAARPGAFAPTGAMATYFNTCAEFLPTKYKPIEYHAMKELINETITKG